MSGAGGGIRLTPTEKEIAPAEEVRQAAFYVDRILRGAKPSNLPVQAPVKYTTVLNLKTAKALGLEVPTRTLMRGLMATLAKVVTLPSASMISGEFFLTATAVATCIRRRRGGEGADVWPPPKTSNATAPLTTMIAITHQNLDVRHLPSVSSSGSRAMSRRFRGQLYESVRRYVCVPQDIRFSFQILQSMLYDITDADNADQLAVCNHEQMPHTVMRHQAHGAPQGIVRGNSDCRLSDDILDRHGKCSLPMSRDGMHDVAFRYESDDCIAVFHDQCRNAPLLHPIGGVPDRLSRADRDDLAAIAIKNSLNAHDHDPR